MATTSPNMSLAIPAFGDPSPGYVTNIAASLTSIDTHDHSSGKGLQVTPAGLNINADLQFNANNALNVRSYRMLNNGAPLALAADKNSVYASGGNLYFNNNSGTAVQITAGNSLNAAAVGGIGGNYVASGALVSYDDTNKIYNFYQSGGTVYSSIASGNLFIKSSTPLVDFKDTNAGSFYAWRVSGSNENLLRFSVDSNLSAATDATSKFYTSTPTAMVLTIPSGLTNTAGALAGLGVNINPTTAAPGGAGTIFAAYNGNVGGQTYTGIFHNPNAQGYLLIGGAQTGTPGNKGPDLYWWIPTLGTCDMGLLSNLGATNTGGAAGDMSLRMYANESALVVQGAGSNNVGIGTATPANRLTVAGAASIGASVAGTAAPANGLLVQGTVTSSTSLTGPQPNTVGAVSPFAFPATALTVVYYAVPGARAYSVSGAVTLNSDHTASIGPTTTANIPFSLPVGPSIKNVQFWYNGSATAGSMTITLFARSAVGGTPATIGTSTITITVGDNSGGISGLTTQASDAQMFYLQVVTNGAAPTVKIYGAEIGVAASSIPLSVVG